MVRKLLFASFLALVGSTTLDAQQSAEVRQQVLIETNRGKFVVELYNETPKHRDNFLAQVRAGAYEDVIFHRIIKDFMIQGGNLEAKSSLKSDEELPVDSTAGIVMAELMPERFIHLRGSLAAARLPDDVNPEKESSATQFYIVTGKFYTEFDMKEIMAKGGYQYSPEQVKQYMLQGGTPHLDGNYTVFGRLVDGWSVVDKIQRFQTNEEDRPLKSIFIRRMRVLEGKERKKL
ncbi:peptidylprolyl isomerase [Porphyromonas sp. COT-239 OH1446]|uniref:peptidylprolyl isomerase n=1 Tax=Porphyromonas sp. COT-239 OH1446 TaxID=1515613 RepID=UPI00052CC783|nr:peptidylprolyl isomerase [Porphyromonas sp. COT-239 OH1446]KGN72212.1 peptidylprolyl isomerase [Porphyromonas sp. COT-239 OH1446]